MQVEPSWTQLSKSVQIAMAATPNVVARRTPHLELAADASDATNVVSR